MGMVAYDFEYDGILLSDMGCMLCVIDTSLDQSITVGTDITFNTVKAFGGKRFYSTHTTYESPIEQTYEICKRCDYNSDGFTLEEVRELTKWLKRKNKHKLKFIGDEFKDFYLEASFNVYTVEKSGKILGLQLNMQANTAYPIHEPIKLSFTSPGLPKQVYLWEKYTINKKIVETQKNNVSLSVSINTTGVSNPYDNADYSDKIEIVNDNLSLVNPSTVLVSTQERAEILLGKFVKLYVNSSNSYYRIPNNAIITFKRDQKMYSYTVDTAYLLSIGTEVTKGTYIETVSSYDINKYPIDGKYGDYWYVYKGKSDNAETIESTIKYTIKNESDDEGVLYPDTKIIAFEDGDIELKITHNQKIISDTIINNCITNEIITLSYPIISSSIDSHNVSDDFNWDFPSFENEYADNINIVTIPSNCKVEFVYTPAVKVSI